MRNDQLDADGLAVDLLWPEYEAEPDGRLDAESAVLAERRARSFRLYARGRTLKAVAEETGLSLPTVHRDVQHVLAAYRRQAMQDAAAHVARELARLAAIEGELWAAWERSKGEAVDTTVRRKGGGGGDEATVRKRQQVGGAVWMKLLQANWDRRCRLLGLLSAADDPAAAAARRPETVVRRLAPGASTAEL